MEEIASVISGHLKAICGFSAKKLYTYTLQWKLSNRRRFLKMKAIMLTGEKAYPDAMWRFLLFLKVCLIRAVKLHRVAWRGVHQQSSYHYLSGK
jgi:hypothetical protein